MKTGRRKRIAPLLVLLLVLLLSQSVASANTGGFVWLGPTGTGGWNAFMQTILQQDYRLQMSNGNPYWNALMVPVASTGISSGMSSYMGMPAFGFCPVQGQCYMVLVQRPASFSSMAPVCPPPQAIVPGPVVPNQQGKPTSLW